MEIKTEKYEKSTGHVPHESGRFHFVFYRGEKMALNIWASGLYSDLARQANERATFLKFDAVEVEAPQ